MLGIVIPEFSRERYARIMGMNADKNYLTPLELAALADNHLLVPNEDSLKGLLEGVGVDVASSEARDVLTEALRLTRLARGEG